MLAGHSAGDGWLEAPGFLASEIVALVDSGSTSLAEVQRTLLRPLELEAMGAGDVGLPNPARLMVRVMSVIEAQRAHPGC